MSDANQLVNLRVHYSRNYNKYCKHKDEDQQARMGSSSPPLLLLYMTSFQLAETLYSHVIGVCNKVLLTMLISSTALLSTARSAESYVVTSVVPVPVPVTLAVYLDHRHPLGLDSIP